MLQSEQIILENGDEMRRLLVFGDCACLVLGAPSPKPSGAKTVLMLGGRGSTATETNITDPAATSFRRELLKRGYIVLCPDCGADNWGGPEATRIVVRVLEELPSAGIPVAGRMQLIGFSMGALGAMMFAVRHPERVSRIVGVFGGYDLPDIYRRIKEYRPGIAAVYPTPELMAAGTPYEHIDQLTHFPVRLFHGQEDTLIPCEYSQRLCKMLNEARGNATLSLVPGVGHNNDLLSLARESLLTALEKNEE